MGLGIFMIFFQKYFNVCSTRRLTYEIGSKNNIVGQSSFYAEVVSFLVKVTNSIRNVNEKKYFLHENNSR